MTGDLYQRGGHYPKKKEKKKSRGKERGFLERTYEWVKWKKTEIGSFSFHRPCLEQ